MSRPSAETLFVDVEPDVRIAVERWSADGPPAGTVLALHGFGSNRLAFAGLSRALPADVELIAVDCRGRGRSSAPEDPARFGMRRHADDAAAVLRELGVSDVVVVGTSMGAWIATQLAAHHADLVRALVLVDGGYLQLLPPGVDPVEFVDYVLLGSLGGLDVVLPDLDAMIPLLSRTPGIADVWDADMETSMREGFEQVEGGWRGRLRRAAATEDARSYNDPVEAPYLRTDLARIACPVHLITAPVGLPVDATRASLPIMPDQSVVELQAALPQLTVDRTTGTNHFTVCIGEASHAAVVPAVQRLLRPTAAS